MSEQSAIQCTCPFGEPGVMPVVNSSCPMHGERGAGHPAAIRGKPFRPGIDFDNTMRRPSQPNWDAFPGVPALAEFKIHDRITQEGWNLYFTIEWVGDELFGVRIMRASHVERTMSNRRQPWKMWED